jgi:hypothetical protein
MTADAIGDRLQAARALHEHRPRPTVRGPGALRCRLVAERGRWRALRADGRWWDEVVLHRLLAAAAALVWYGYTYPRGFAVAHALGWVSRAERERRMAICSDCRYRVIHDGRAYCNGDHGGRGCGCPRWWWWPFSRLAWLTWLRNRPCPLGRFPRRFA